MGGIKGGINEMELKFINLINKLSFILADRKGFEPSRRLPAYSLSRGAPSTTRPPIRRKL